ncbi:MAG: DUF6176 family protein [Cyanobacteria bacterium J06643_5]
METCCWKIKIKPGMLNRVRQWVDEVCQRREEYIEAIAAERSYVEAIFLDSNYQGDFLIFYHKAADIDKALEYFWNSSKPIDVHKREYIKDAWESYERIELLLEVEAPMES